jgi:hypothetical protein
LIRKIGTKRCHKLDPSKSGFVGTFLVTPLLDMKSMVVKKRSAVLIALIVIQLLVYCVYIFVLNSTTSLLYLYMLIRWQMD